MVVNGFKEYKFDSLSLSQSLKSVNCTQYANRTYLDCNTIDTLYRQNSYIRKIVDLIPQDANTHAPQWLTSDIEQQKIVDYCQSIPVKSEVFKRLTINDAFCLAHTYARKYGDGFIFLGIEDAQESFLPVELSKVKAVSYALVKHKYQVALNPAKETITCLLTNGMSIEFHFSRVLRFEGISSGFRQDEFNASVVDSAFESYQNYQNALTASKDMLLSHSVFKYGIQGLGNYFKLDKERRNQRAISDRFTSLLEGINRMGALIFDKSDETIEFANRSYAGIQPIMQHLQDWLVACSDMPRSKIIGSAASSALSESSEGEKSVWNETIQRHQNLVLRPNHLALGKYIMLSLGVKKPSLNVEYEPHYSLSLKEQSDLKQVNAITDEKYLKLGVLSVDEVRQARFGGTEYSQDVQTQKNSKLVQKNKPDVPT